MKRRLSLANIADMAVILSALTFVGVTARNYLGSASASSASPAQDLVGKRLAPDGLDAAASDRTLLLVLAGQCGYCRDSADLYRRLSGNRKRAGFTLVASFPDQAEGDAFLKAHGIEVDRIVIASPRSLGVPGTPTLLLFDRASYVRSAWFGRLRPEGEAKLLEILDMPARAASAGP